MSMNTRSSRAHFRGLVLALIAVLPVLVLAAWSLSRGWLWPALLPRAWSLRAWRYAASPLSGVPQSLAVSIFIALIVAALAVLLAVPAARAIALHSFRGRQAVLFILLLPVLAPPVASAMGVHSLFIRLGLAETVFGVILVHLIPAVPYSTLMMVGAFSRFETDQEAVARTLGASTYHVWLRVTLPALAPGIAVSAVFAFLISWSQYLLTLLVGGGQVRTLPLSLIAFQTSGDDAVAAALALLYLAPAVFLFLAVSRFLRADA
ncbi:MAG: ABC transporter permease subunit [Bryobacterales bacterium]|nr:ABC transporter permease subunit [Bryobacterales bacterium]